MCMCLPRKKTLSGSRSPAFCLIFALMSMTSAKSAMSIWKSRLGPVIAHQMRRLPSCHYLNAAHIKTRCVLTYRRGYGCRVGLLNLGRYNEAYVLFQGCIVKHSIWILGRGGIERVCYGRKVVVIFRKVFGANLIVQGAQERRVGRRFDLRAFGRVNNQNTGICK